MKETRVGFVKRGAVVAALLFASGAAMSAQEAASGLPDWFPELKGTLRAKAEFQPSAGESRFQVRNARVALAGSITPIVYYKGEVDFCDRGVMRALDAYAGVTPLKDFHLRMGQMRVPFGIDAHRSPHLQFFANRSFLAKQVGDVRDVGCYAGYTIPGKVLKLEAGLFNGSGLLKQKDDAWTRSLNFSAKAQCFLPFGLTLQTSVQKISPAGGAAYLYDGGATLCLGGWTLEAEYLRKHYANATFGDVDAFNAFVCYNLPLKKAFRKMSFLARFDMMGNHSDGKTFDEKGELAVTDAARKRLTGGITLSFAKKFHADLRLNYEKYFYKNEALALPSERDKAVVELVVHFPAK